jgi:hypothetical protein
MLPNYVCGGSISKNKVEKLVWDFEIPKTYDGIVF